MAAHLTKPRKLGFEKQLFGADEQVRGQGLSDYQGATTPPHVASFGAVFHLREQCTPRYQHLMLSRLAWQS
jgi:hypothetical protein